MARQASDGRAELGAWMRGLRQRARLSQKKVAEIMYGEREAESRRGEIIRWEQGRHAPSTESLWLYLKAVGVKFTETPPDDVPQPLNAEVAALRRQVEALAEGELQTVLDLVEKQSSALEDQTKALRDVRKALAEREAAATPSTPAQRP